MTTTQVAERTTEIAVCIDCLNVLTYGPDRNGEEFDASERMITLWGHTYSWNILLGGDDLGFSSSACDGCGSHLAGERYSAHVLEPPF